MFYLPHKIATRRLLGLCTYALLAGVLFGCAGSSEKPPEFKPPAFPAPPDSPRFIYERTLRSSLDVQEETAADKFRLFATGGMSTGTGLDKPYGIAVHKGRVYVTDTVQRAILVFDGMKKQFTYMGTDEGPGQVLKPMGIDTDAAGNVYVADNTGQKVVIYDPNGKFLQTLGTPGSLHRPTGIAVNPEGTRVYVVDTGGVDTAEHHLLIYDRQSGELLKTVGTRGTEPGEFNLPLLAAMDRNDGTVYVVDGGNFRVEAFNPDGSFKALFGSVGIKIGQFARPKGIAVDSIGNVYVIDTSHANFQLFDKQGQLLMFAGGRGARGGPAEFQLPAGIAVDEDGRVYVADQFFKKVDVFRPVYLGTDEGYLSGKPLTTPRTWADYTPPAPATK